MALGGASPSAGGAGARELRILVAEPSRTLAALIRATLADLGAEIELAADGAQALAAARARLPDVLVCDQGLSGLDGYALAHAVKQLAGKRALQTLLLVPDHAAPDPERLAYVGIGDVLGKPFERAVLLERVRGLLPAPPAPAPGLPPPAHAAPYGTSPAGVPSHPPSYVSAPGHTPMAPLYATPPHAQGPTPERLDELVEQRVVAALDARLAQAVEARLGALVTQRLPALLDAALARLLPQVVHEATQRAVAERVPAAVDGAARVALAEVATPTRIDRIVGDVARAAAERAVNEALQPLVGGAVDAVKARVEAELLLRLDHFAKTELPARLSSHAEQIVWKVVPTLAEDLIKDELKRLTAD